MEFSAMGAGTGFRGVAGVKSLQGDVTRRRRLLQDASLRERNRSAAMVEAAELLDQTDGMATVEARA